MSSLNLLLGAVIILLIALPPKYDPAIRLKIWLDQKNR